MLPSGVDKVLSHWEVQFIVFLVCFDDQENQAKFLTSEPKLHVTVLSLLGIHLWKMEECPSTSLSFSIRTTHETSVSGGDHTPFVTASQILTTRLLFEPLIRVRGALQQTWQSRPKNTVSVNKKFEVFLNISFYFFPVAGGSWAEGAY